MFKRYYRLTKPGIVYGNITVAAAGFFFAARGNIDLLLLVSMLSGLGLIIASACVFNNILDRDIDKKMERTKSRALVKKTISKKSAVIFGAVIGLLGALILLYLTNIITLVIAAIGFIFYVPIYTYSKRLTKNGTLIGSIAGAVPPVVGYVAVSGKIDLGALLLFITLTCWQMPHFYAISLFRMKDYANANIPIYPIKSGIFETKIYMIFYIICFLISTYLLYYFRLAGNFYLTLIILLNIIWLTYGLLGFGSRDTNTWSRKMFYISLVVLMSFSFLISIDWAFL